MTDAITINMDTTTGAITVTAPDGNEEVEMKIASLMGDMIATIIEEETGTRPAYRVLPSEVADELEQLRAENARLRRVVDAAVKLELHLDEIFKLFPGAGTTPAERALARLGDYTNQYKMASESPAQGE